MQTPLKRKRVVPATSPPVTTPSPSHESKSMRTPTRSPRLPLPVYVSDKQKLKISATSIIKFFLVALSRSMIISSQPNQGGVVSSSLKDNQQTVPKVIERQHVPRVTWYGYVLNMISNEWNQATLTVNGATVDGVSDWIPGDVMSISGMIKKVDTKTNNVMISGGLITHYQRDLHWKYEVDTVIEPPPFDLLLPPFRQNPDDDCSIMTIPILITETIRKPMSHGWSVFFVSPQHSGTIFIFCDQDQFFCKPGDKLVVLGTTSKFWTDPVSGNRKFQLNLEGYTGQFFFCCCDDN